MKLNNMIEKIANAYKFYKYEKIKSNILLAIFRKLISHHFYIMLVLRYISKRIYLKFSALKKNNTNDYTSFIVFQFSLKLQNGQSER